MTTLDSSPRSLAPTPETLPDVLPNERLFASGKPKPGVDPGIRSISNWRNAFAVGSVYVQILGGWYVAGRVDHPLVWIAGVIWATRCIAMLNLLNHEAVHALLFESRSINDNVARYGLAPAAVTDFDAYRRAHLAHHKDELGPEEPDVSMYAPYPSGERRLARRLTRDLLGISGAKLLLGLARASWRVRRRILIAQLVMFTIAWAVTGVWWGWIAAWFVPWLTVWQVNNRLRAIAEHGGMQRSRDRRVTTHVVEQGPLASFMLAPYQAGYHLAHHVDTSVPWNRLARLHRELVASGWVTVDMTHPNYRSLWRYLATGKR